VPPQMFAANIVCATPHRVYGSGAQDWWLEVSPIRRYFRIHGCRPAFARQEAASDHPTLAARAVPELNLRAGVAGNQAEVQR
jgi:hypothetical protein